ncbi:hypothetical protein LX73_1911 [Fodinibius salinus]|uniref:Uncharacterized protein n=1 Tax=Fodinibius salinus TaxID=860790 RepID=A0A5D3YH79_9BACT|nr:hypothetical protein [Fodinibius salinus]TYP92549.1 hypothetical protein LX73_1911 [Fodinibius salinus]
MKSLIKKLFALIFIVTLTVGCASSLTAPQTEQQADTEQVNDELSDNVDFGTDSDMNTMRDKPE